jgi:hypothetical protein
MNDSGGRVFQPALLRALREYLGRPGWDPGLPDIRFTGSLDSSSVYNPPARYVHDIVSGQTIQQIVTDLPTAMAAISRPPKYYIFFAGANDLGTRTIPQILGDYISACASVLTNWSGATIPVVMTPKDDAAFVGAVNIPVLRAAILAGGVPNAGAVVDTTTFPLTALAADGIHPLGPDSPTVGSSWATMPTTTNGPAACARLLLAQLLRPGETIPLLAGE